MSTELVLNEMHTDCCAFALLESRSSSFRAAWEAQAIRTCPAAFCWPRCILLCRVVFHSRPGTCLAYRSDWEMCCFQQLVLWVPACLVKGFTMCDGQPSTEDLCPRRSQMLLEKHVMEQHLQETSGELADAERELSLSRKNSPQGSPGQATPPGGFMHDMRSAAVGSLPDIEAEVARLRQENKSIMTVRNTCSFACR